MTADFWSWVVILFATGIIGSGAIAFREDWDNYSNFLFIGIYTGAPVFSLANLLFEVFSSRNELLFITGVVATIIAAVFSLAETLCALVGCIDTELKKRALFHWLAIVLPSALLLGVSAII